MTTSRLRLSPRTATRIATPLLVLAVGLGGFLYLKATKPDSPKPHAREKVWQVTVVPAQPASRSPSLTLYGKVETPELLQAAAPGAGVVTELPAREGNQVKAGDLLLALDERDFRPAVVVAETEVRDLEAQMAVETLRYRTDQAALEDERRLLELAAAGVERAKRLKRQNLGSDSTLDSAREALGRQELALKTRQLAVDSFEATLRQLRARLERSRARLQQAELALVRSRVVAPFDGVVASVQVARGDLVQPAQNLLALYPLDSLEVRARIPARYQAEIQGALAGATPLKAIARPEGAALEFELVRLSGEADPSGIDAFFRVTGPRQSLRLGNLLKMELQRPAQEATVAVPFQAVYGNSRIYIMEGERMKGIDVEPVGPFSPADGTSALLVRSDQLEPGTPVIVTHLPNAVTGLRVRTATP